MSEPSVGVDRLAECLGGRWVNVSAPPPKRWLNARSDSRTIRPGEIFVAIPGKRTDGHNHLEDARAKGAILAVVLHPVPSSPLPQLLVPDVVLALREMAKLALLAHRKVGHRLVTLTGSVGKTTTRELLRLGLMPEGGAHASRGNENNEIGVPLTLLSWPTDHRNCLLEVGVRVPGDMDYLAPLLLADAGIITAIAPGHLESLGSVGKVWEEKSKLLKAVVPGGSLILPDPVRQAFLSDPLFQDRSWRIVSGAIEAEGALPESAVATLRETPTGLVLHLEDSIFDLPLSRPSLALAWCTLLAILALQELGVQIWDAAPRLAAYDGFSGRMERKEHPSGLLLLLDHYNANPASMNEALNWVSREKRIRKGAKSYAVLGDMLELGQDSAHYHEDLGRQAARSGIERVWYRGQMKEFFIQGFQEEGGDPGRVHPAEDFSTELAHGHGPTGADVLLVKGSRGMKLEEVVAPLLEGI